jgi:hypothetical protein
MRSNIWSFAIVELLLSLSLRVGADQTDALINLAKAAQLALVSASTLHFDPPLDFDISCPKR